jgi:hypothetical protein
MRWLGPSPALLARLFGKRYEFRLPWGVTRRCLPGGNSRQDRSLTRRWYGQAGAVSGDQAELPGPVGSLGTVGGVVRAGLGRRRAVLLGGAAAVLLGGWFAATAVIAGHGWYDTRSSQVPWLPIAAAGSLGALLAASRIPVVARALTAPGMASRLVLPHAFRVTGVFFLLYLALAYLPALFALQAGLGDIAAGIAAPLVARRLAQGTGRRAAMWFNVYGLTDLAAGITLGALTGYGLLHVTPSSTPISQLPLALVIAADVPLMLALHTTSLVTLARAARPRPPAAARSFPVPRRALL